VLHSQLTICLGPGNCVGRSLALHELRTVLAAVVRRFDARFAPGFKAQDWIDQLSDHYILVRGKLDVVLSKRPAVKA
jgi:cytochrome P450